jgi:hypothetical protein
VLKADTISSDSTNINGLAANQKYYWRVQASNSAGASSWSDTWNFTTGLEWEKTNAPSTNEIKCFAWNGKDLFVGTSGGGILHSTDNGMNWNPVNNGLTDLRVDCIFISGNNLFAGTYNSGIFLSTNNGSSWTLIKSMYYVNTFAKIGSNLFVGTDHGVYLSKDGGKNWSEVTPNSIIDFGTIGNNLFGGNYTGIYLSTDFGTSWNKVNNNDIECLTTVNSKIFAGCNTNQGIIRSTNNGVSWTTVNTGLTYKYSFDLATCGLNLFTLYSSDILLSTNYGDNWTSVDLGFTNSYRRAMGVNLNYLFVGTSSDGIWRRRLIEMTGVNPPANTQLISPIMSQTISTDTVNLKWNSAKDATLYVLQLSKDQSFTSILNTDTVTTDTIKAIAGLSKNQKYYWRVLAENEAGVSQWSDIWNFTLAGVGPKMSRSNNSISFNPVLVGQFKDTIITITNSGDDTLKILNISSSLTVFSARPTTRSVPPGQSFSDTLRFSPAAIGSASGALLLYSNASSSPDTIKVSGVGFGNAAIQLSKSSIFFGSVKVNQFKDTIITITNSGNDTLKISKFSASNTAFSARPTTRNVPPSQSFSDTLRFAPAVIGSASGTLLLYSNAVSSPDTIKISGTCVAAPTLQLNTVSVSFGSVKIGQFKDTTITLTNNGNDTLKISNIASSISKFAALQTKINIAPGQSYIDTLRYTPTFVRTDSAFITILSNTTKLIDTIKVLGVGISGTNVDQKIKLPTCFALDQNYPNPFNPSTMITYQIPNDGAVRLSIYDVMGRMLTTLVNKEQSAGQYAVSFDGSKFTSGIYLYRINVITRDGKSFSQTNKMILMK